MVLSILIFSDVKAQSLVNDKESARVFVQKFYDWYGALDSVQGEGPSNAPSPYSLMLKHKPPYLQSTLLDALIADDEAQAKVPGDIVGLDFDPITNAQDTRSGYQIGEIKQQGDKLFVDIHDIKSGQSQKAILAAPLVLTAEVVKISGQWEFFNFIYPKADGGNNLLDILKDLKNDRVKWAVEANKKKSKE